MSKQLSLSATISVLAMAVFALVAAYAQHHLDAARSPAGSTAPAIEAALPAS